MQRKSWRIRRCWSRAWRAEWLCRVPVTCRDFLGQRPLEGPWLWLRPQPRCPAPRPRLPRDWALVDLHLPLPLLLQSPLEPQKPPLFSDSHPTSSLETWQTNSMPQRCPVRRPKRLRKRGPFWFPWKLPVSGEPRSLWVLFSWTVRRQLKFRLCRWRDQRRPPDSRRDRRRGFSIAALVLLQVPFQCLQKGFPLLVRSDRSDRRGRECSRRCCSSRHDRRGTQISISCSFSTRPRFRFLHSVLLHSNCSDFRFPFI